MKLVGAALLVTLGIVAVLAARRAIVPDPLDEWRRMRDASRPPR